MKEVVGIFRMPKPGTGELPIPDLRPRRDFSIDIQKT